VHFVLSGHERLLENGFRVAESVVPSKRVFGDEFGRSMFGIHSFCGFGFVSLARDGEDRRTRSRGRLACLFLFLVR
jgi:hypothetical protein